MIKLLITSALLTALAAGQALAKTQNVVGPINLIQTRADTYPNGDHNTYVRVGSQMFAIVPTDQMRTQLLATALSARTMGTSVILEYDDATCASHSPDSWCQILDIMY